MLLIVAGEEVKRLEAEGGEKVDAITGGTAMGLGISESSMPVIEGRLFGNSQGGHEEGEEEEEENEPAEVGFPSERVWSR